MQRFLQKKLSSSGSQCILVLIPRTRKTFQKFLLVTLWLQRGEEPTDKTGEGCTNVAYAQMLNTIRAEKCKIFRICRALFNANEIHLNFAKKADSKVLASLLYFKCFCACSKLSPDLIFTHIRLRGLPISNKE